MVKPIIDSRRRGGISGLLVLLVMSGFPGVAAALGLGPVQVKSSLNQPLKAEIILIQTRGEDISSAKASVAPQDAFERVGLTRNAVTNNMRFKIVGDGSAGSPARIIVTTNEVVKEPVLSFLIQLDWSAGTVIREYTILLDPPVTPATEASMPPQRPPVAKPSALPAPGQPSPVRPRPVLLPEPPAATSRPARPAPAPASAPAPRATTTPGAASYGPVRARETLWSIALKLRPDPARITMDQMQIAILNANPAAFENNNINLMIEGSVLKIPPAEQIMALNAEAARQQVASQRAAYRQQAPMNRAVAESRPAPADAPAATPAPEPQAAAPITPQAAEAPATPPAGQTVEATGKADSQPAPAPATQAADAAAADQPDIDPEAQAALETMFDEANAVDAAASTESPESSADTVDADADVDAVEATGQTSDQTSDQTSGQTSSDAPADAAAEPESIFDGSEDVDAEAPAEPPPAAPSAVEWDEGGSSASGLFNPLNLAGGAAIIALLIAALWYNRKRRNKEAQAERVEPMPDASAPDAAGMGVVGADAMATGHVEEVASAEPVGSPEEVLSEVDMHLAYGLHEECEGMLKPVIAANPDRQDLKVKLLEVYSAAGNKEAFEELAAELKTSIGTDDPEWSKIADMGNKLIPGSVLFGGAVAAAAADDDGDAVAEAAPEPEPEPEPAADDGTAEDFEALLAAAGASSETAQSEAVDESDSFDFEDLSKSLESDDEFENDSAEDAADELKGLEDVAGKSKASAADDGLEFNIDDLDFGLDTDEPAAAAAPAKASTDGDGGLEFDLSEFEASIDAPEQSASASKPKAAADDDADQGLDFDISGDADDVAPAEELSVADDSGQEDLDALISDLEADTGASVADDSAESEGGSEADEEMATKLDLARAYIDMGEPGMAESLLQEVVEGGNAAQRSEAQGLLKS